MDSQTKNYLIENAQSLFRDYLEKIPPGADDKPSLHRAYDLLVLLASGPNSAPALATYLKLSAHTIFEYMGVLESAGLPIARMSRTNQKATGRPITVFYLNQDSD